MTDKKNWKKTKKKRKKYEKLIKKLQVLFLQALRSFFCATVYVMIPHNYSHNINRLMPALVRYWNVDVKTHRVRIFKRGCVTCFRLLRTCLRGKSLKYAFCAQVFSYILSFVFFFTNVCDECAMSVDFLGTCYIYFHQELPIFLRYI